MSIRGGYQILDLKNTLFQTIDETHTVDNSYDSVSNSDKKPIMVCNLNISDKVLSPFFMTFYKDGTTYYGYIPFHSYVVDAYDGVIKLVIESDNTVSFIGD